MELFTQENHLYWLIQCATNPNEANAYRTQQDNKPIELNLFGRIIFTYLKELYALSNKGKPAIVIHRHGKYPHTEDVLRRATIKIDDNSIAKFSPNQAYSIANLKFLYHNNGLITLSREYFHRIITETEYETHFGLILLKTLNIKNPKILTQEQLTPILDAYTRKNLKEFQNESLQKRIKSVMDEIQYYEDDINRHLKTIETIKSEIRVKQNEITHMQDRVLKGEKPTNIAYQFIEYVNKLKIHKQIEMHPKHNGIVIRIHLFNLNIKNMDKPYLERSLKYLYTGFTQFPDFLKDILNDNLKINIGDYTINIEIPFDKSERIVHSMNSLDDYHNPHIEMGCIGTYHDAIRDAQQERQPIVLFNILLEQLTSINFTDGGSDNLPKFCKLITETERIVYDGPENWSYVNSEDYDEDEE